MNDNEMDETRMDECKKEETTERTHSMHTIVDCNLRTIDQLLDCSRYRHRLERLNIPARISKEPPDSTAYTHMPTIYVSPTLTLEFAPLPTPVSNVMNSDSSFAQLLSEDREPSIQFFSSEAGQRATEPNSTFE